MIELEGVCKTYRVAQREAGFKAAAKALIHRRYKTIEALRNVSFSIRDGEMVGYIGPNGAGKSSTIKIMSGILTPDAGKCIINGRIPWKQRRAHVRDIGVVFGQRSQLWWDVPVVDSFELLREIYRVPDKLYRENLERLTRLLDIGGLVKTPVRQLSLGQRQRCEIAAALLHEPKLLFLDEPTIGLDEVSKRAVREFIREQNRLRGTTVVLTTHDMQDIEALTERILLIGHGKILVDGPLSGLQRAYGAKKVMTIWYDGELPELLPGMVNKNRREGELSVEIDTSVLSVERALGYFSERTKLSDVTVTGPSAEDLVLALYKEHNI